LTSIFGVSNRQYVASGTRSCPITRRHGVAEPRGGAAAEGRGLAAGRGGTTDTSKHISLVDVLTNRKPRLRHMPRTSAWKSRWACGGSMRHLCYATVGHEVSWRASLCVEQDAWSVQARSVRPAAQTRVRPVAIGDRRDETGSPGRRGAGRAVYEGYIGVNPMEITYMDQSHKPSAQLDHLCAAPCLAARTQSIYRKAYEFCREQGTAHVLTVEGF
jgi:hypothetical protein